MIIKNIERLCVFMVFITFFFAVIVDQKKIQNKIALMLINELSLKFDKVDVNVMVQPKIKISDSNYKLRINLPERKIGLIVIPVTITTRQQSSKHYFTAEVKVSDQVWVFSRPLNRFFEISEQSLEKKNVDITHLLLKGKNIIKKKKNVVGKFRTKGYVSKNEILCQELLEPIPDVVKNRELLLIVRAAPVSIKMRVEALDDGFIGDTIKVSNSKYKKVLFAKILNSREVILVN